MQCCRGCAAIKLDSNTCDGLKIAGKHKWHLKNREGFLTSEALANFVAHSAYHSLPSIISFFFYDIDNFFLYARIFSQAYHQATSASSC